ncbi:MAG: hypothetical protein CMB79_19565 [Filomicrobium sp.]|nr:hypothetical protein [Filomicrobium sp.]
MRITLVPLPPPDYSILKATIQCQKATYQQVEFVIVDRVQWLKASSLADIEAEVSVRKRPDAAIKMRSRGSMTKRKSIKTIYIAEPSFGRSSSSRPAADQIRAAI